MDVHNKRHQEENVSSNEMRKRVRCKVEKGEEGWSDIRTFLPFYCSFSIAHTLFGNTRRFLCDHDHQVLLTWNDNDLTNDKSRNHNASLYRNFVSANLRNVDGIPSRRGYASIYH
jgi:hypothetical protein